MKKNLLKTICITLVAVLCMGSLNAQQARKLDQPTKPVSQFEDATTKITPSNRAVIYSEGFETTTIDIFEGSLPTGWLRSYKGEYNWMVVDDQPNFAPECYNIPNVINKVPPFEGSQFMALSWIDCGKGNWAISEGFALTAGETYEISFQLVMPGYPTWNETSSFECRIGTTPTESAMLSAHLLYTKTERITEWTLVSASFAPPTTGTYYLFFNDNTPLTPSGWGIYHGIDDVKVLSSDLPSCDPAKDLTVNYEVNCEATLSWTAPADNPTAKYNIYRDGDKIVPGHSSTTYLDKPLPSPGGFNPAEPHKWEVRAICPTSNESTGISVEKPLCKECAKASNLTVEIKDNCQIAKLKWDASPDAKSYEVWKDGEKVGDPTVAEFEHIGDYKKETKWDVYAVCEVGKSDPIKETTPACVGINENKFNFSIQPNPAYDKLTISATTNFNSVEIVNFLGQTVLTHANNTTTTTTIDVFSLNAGVYFVRIISNAGTSVQKFVKK